MQMPRTRPEWSVRGVAVIGDHTLRLLFDDGTVGDVSYESREWTGVLAPLNDPDYFAQVQVAHGTVHWSQDDIDLAPEPLYEAAKASRVAQSVIAAAA